jgi:hypothetical protein
MLNTEVLFSRRVSLASYTALAGHEVCMAVGYACRSWYFILCSYKPHRLMHATIGNPRQNLMAGQLWSEILLIRTPNMRPPWLTSHLERELMPILPLICSHPWRIAINIIVLSCSPTSWPKWRLQLASFCDCGGTPAPSTIAPEMIDVRKFQPQPCNHGRLSTATKPLRKSSTNGSTVLLLQKLLGYVSCCYQAKCTTI